MSWKRVEFDHNKAAERFEADKNRYAIQLDGVEGKFNVLATRAEKAEAHVKVLEEQVKRMETANVNKDSENNTLQ